MLSRIVLLTAAFGLMTGVAMAQTPAPLPQNAARVAPVPPDQFKHLTAEQQAALVNEKDPLVLSIIQNHEDWYSQVNARNGAGEAEVHDHWMDIFAVVKGQASLTYGGTVSGNRSTGAGEWRGGTITGGTTITIKPGDYIQIPIGMPHQVVPAPGAHFRAIVLKMRQ